MHNTPFYFKLDMLDFTSRLTTFQSEGSKWQLVFWIDGKKGCLMILIDGKKIAEEIRLEMKKSIAHIQGRRPALAVIVLGEHPPSLIYIDRKIAACAEVGIISIQRRFPATMPEDALLHEIRRLNEDPAVDGILIQLPLPQHIDSSIVIQTIAPEKDVDGFHPMNVGKMLIGAPNCFLPCTPLAVKTLLARYEIDPAGKHVVICGRSNIVGKPMAAMLMQSTPGGNATVSIAHRMTTDINALCLMADILIAAIGQPKFIVADMVKQGAVIIDVGINRIPPAAPGLRPQIVGDVDFENVKGKCSYITPVPGGVGPMTIAMLLKNTLQSFFAKGALINA